MYCAADNRRSRQAFTLFEVLISVFIMALVILAIYRFVVGSVTAIQVSTDDTNRKSAVQALVAVLQEEFSNLPPSEPGALLGEGHQFAGKASDQIEWLTQAGNGMFTGDADGQWQLTLLLRPQGNTNTYTLGLLRQVPNSNVKQENWLPLLPNVDAIEIRYYDSRLNTWLEKWSDSSALPSLVRIRIWRTGQDVPYETIIELPPTTLPA
ncbi:MAG: prepilin-type N-terminal cleavage/methylation domain-containing protein [Chthoniobacteraceae bacterium]|jgi:prepilin-type N-terminal cleavage/methylation domain-containing protein